VVLHPKDTVFKSLEIAKLENIHSVVGGDERVDSVLSGLKYLNHIPRSSDWIMVHDAARPCVSNKDIDTLIETVESAASSDISGAILAMRVRDTMKRSKPENGLNVSLKTVPREDLWHALTPQLFSIQSLIESIERALDKGYPVTDEASAMEASGHAVALVEGSTKNIKITTPEDLDLAAFYLAESSKQTKRRD
jgi:2-C-methyl-D-erythritol 4-phosphate cytidylyltransferase